MKLPLELLYNLRLLRKNLGFVAICVLMIGMGMGLSITMYSITLNVDTRLLPFENGDRFVDIFGYDTSPNPGRQVVTDGFIYQLLQASSTSFETLGAFSDFSAVFSDGIVSERFEASRVDPELFQASGVVPAFGRTLQVSDSIVGSPAIAVISHRLWQNYYAGKEDILGTVSRINGEPVTIVGVMPEGFAYPMFHDIWMPLQVPGGVEPGQFPRLSIQGVLYENVSIETAKVEIENLFQQLGATFPDEYGDVDPRVRNCCRIINYSDDDSPGAALLAMLTFSLLFLICLNVANLFLVRTNQRIHEFSIRSALGASRSRLILAVLQDSLLITFLGALLGFILADLGMTYVGTAADEALSVYGDMPFTFYFGWETSIAVTAVFLILIIWVLTAGLAVWQISRQDLSQTLAGGKTGATESHSAFGTATMVSIEVIFSCFLLVFTGVLIGASIQSANTDYGTATEGYITGRVDLPLDNFPDSSSREEFRQNLQLELLSQNGIDEVSFTEALPSQGGTPFLFQMTDRDVRVEERYPLKALISVANNYFETMDITLRAGRNFDSTDTSESAPVIIIDEVFAEQMWPEEANPVQAAVGKTIQISARTEPPIWETRTIVGVISHVIQGVAMDGINRTAFYQPFSQRSISRGVARLNVVAKVSGAPDDYRQTLQLAAANTNRNVPVASISSLTDWLTAANSVVVFATEASTGMAVLTLALAVTGIFAIISRSVRQRTKEIGIRRAVGSSNHNVLWVFMLQGLRYLGLGLTLGGGTAILASGAISNESIQLVEWLPLVLVAVSSGLACLVLLATYGPASQLIAMEPGETLRDE